MTGKQPTLACFAARHIRYVELDGAVVILDLARSEYLALQPPLSSLWLSLLHPGGRSISRIDELSRFRREMIASGYIVPEPPDEVSGDMPALSVRRPTTLNAVRSIVAVDHYIGRRQFHEIYRKLQGRKVRRDRRIDRIEAALTCFMRAEGILAYRKQKDDCLRRSLALFHFCSGCGLDVGHVIGVRGNPFQAHAWAHCRGRALLDSATKVEGFKAIAVL